MAKFTDRTEAGQKLAAALVKYRDSAVVVYALPRGGVVLGAEVAIALDAPLDLVITRKIGHPASSEYAICAVAEQGEPVCNETERASVERAWFEAELERARSEAKRRRQTYLAGRKPLAPTGKTAIIVDDGVATGLTIRAAIAELRTHQPAKIVAAVPVVPRATAGILREEADELVALDTPALYLGAVGAYYDHFVQIEDQEVIDLLEQAA